jgi:carboxypeptidase C (cathepsin A)
MNGLFLESGPLRIKRNGTKPGGHDFNDFEIHAAEKSWADDYSVIYLD